MKRNVCFFALMLVGGLCVHAGNGSSSQVGRSSPKKKPTTVCPVDVDTTFFDIGSVPATFDIPDPEAGQNLDSLFEEQGGKEHLLRPATQAWAAYVSAGVGSGDAGLVEETDETFVRPANISEDWSVTECGGDQTARRGSSEGEPVVFTFEVFKETWLEVRLELIEFYEGLMNFRTYFKMMCETPGGQVAFIRQCNNNLVAPDGSPVGPCAFKAFESLGNIEEQYEYVRGKYHRALRFAGALGMGKTAEPLSITRSRFCLSPLKFLRLPCCPLCLDHSEEPDSDKPHVNFKDQKEVLFDDVCPKCRKSFLRELFDADLVGALEVIQEVLQVLKKADDGIACLLPKT